MFLNWSPQMRRIMALGLAAALLLVIFDYIIAPSIGAFATQGERIAELEAQYQRFSAAAARQANAREQLSQLEAETSWREPLMSAPSLRDAAADLQRQVRELAEGAGTTTLSFQPVDRQGDFGFSMPGVRFELEATNAQLDVFVRSLENVPYGLVLDTITIRHRGAVRGSNDQQVRMRGDVFAFWLPPEAGP